VQGSYSHTFPQNIYLRPFLFASDYPRRIVIAITRKNYTKLLKASDIKCWLFLTNDYFQFCKLFRRFGCAYWIKVALETN
jgi:hypothetical protein